MKFEVSKYFLTTALWNVEKAFDNDGIVQIRMTGTTLYVTAKNEELLITTRIEEITADEDFSFKTYGKYLLNIVKKLNGNWIEIKKENNHISLKCEKSKYKLNLVDTPDFEEYQGAYETQFKLSSDVLQNIISKTVVAAADSTSKQILNGVNFKYKDGKLIAYCSDSFRLVRVITDAVAEKEIDIIIPARSLNELSKILINIDVVIKFSSTHARFEIGNTIFETRLISGQYPDVERIISNAYLIEVEYNRKELIDAVERATIVMDKDSSSVIKISVGKTQTAITVTDTQIGDAVEIIDNSATLREIEIAVNYKFLLDALKTFDTDTVKVRFTDCVKPIEICPKNDFSHLHIVLPVRVH